MTTAVPPDRACPAQPADEATWADALARDREARRRHQALGRMARRVAHDANNYLTIIRTYAELLGGAVPPSAPEADDLREIVSATEGLSEYLQGAARFARVGAMRPTEHDLVPLVEDAVRDAEAAGPVRVEVAPVRASVDAVWLGEALAGLLENARAAAGADAPLEVRAGRCVVAAPSVDGGVPIAAGPWAVVEVRDPGAGPAPEVLEAFGDPFVTTRDAVRGAGTTLAAIRAMAWQLDGQFTLVREQDATAARLYLPAR